ncbi:LOW QUALITY PROTEIN: hypothetical protein V2J09_023577 [Rumex salicifolius]
MADCKPYRDDDVAKVTVVHIHNPTSTRRKGSATKEWLVVSESGESHFEVVERQVIMRRTGLHARDLRLLDPALSYPSTILGRERAIVVNLEHIKAIVTAKEVLMINSLNPLFVNFVVNLQEKILSKDQVLPLEFRALEACLESICRCLEIETKALEKEAYPALDELTSDISTLNLERVRQIKSRLVTLSGRVQKLQDELEHLLDDDNDMSEMYLSEKYDDQFMDNTVLREDECNYASDLETDRDIEESRSARISSFYGSKPNVEQLEMLLEAYFAQIDGILQKLSTLSEYVGDTEDYINIMLDDKQNQLLQMGVILSTAIMILNAGVVVVGLFGMNIHIPLYDNEKDTHFWGTAFSVAGSCIALHLIAFGWGMKRSLSKGTFDSIAICNPADSVLKIFEVEQNSGSREMRNCDSSIHIPNAYYNRAPYDNLDPRLFHVKNNVHSIRLFDLIAMQRLQSSDPDIISFLPRNAIPTHFLLVILVTPPLDNANVVPTFLAIKLSYAPEKAP